MEAQRGLREEERRDPGRLASIFSKIPSIPRFSPASHNPQKQRSYPTTFKMTRLSKSAIVPNPGQDPSRQNGAKEFRSKGKQRSLSVNEKSKAGPSRSNETRVESNGDKSATRQRVEPAAVEHSYLSGEASTSAINSHASAVPIAHTVIKTVTADSPIADEASQKHIKKMAHDCYVDLAQSLPSELERAWETKIYQWLGTNLGHSMDDPNDISVELVMAGIKDGGSMYPTILVMCRDLAQKESIDVVLKRCSLIPKNVRRRIIIFDIRKCTSESSVAKPPTERFLGRQIAVDLDDTSNATVLYAKAARIFTSADAELFIFCTIGGMLSVNGKLYGLTTAHPFAAPGSEGRAMPPRTSGSTLLGRVAYAQWPTSAARPVQVAHIPRGEDWALVDIGHVQLSYNTFHVPGAEKPQKVTGYIKTVDLWSGEVWVCAGMSGIQLGFLKQHPAAIMMSGSLFDVRSISLERPLVDGDSGSWVVRDGKLCGFIFCRTSNEVEWAYMLPIEAVLESISKYWESLHPGLPSSKVQIAREEVMDAANKDHGKLPKPEDRSKHLIPELPSLELSEWKSQKNELSEWKSQKNKQDLWPAPSRRRNRSSTFPSIKESGFSDDSEGSATSEETIVWDPKAVLSLDGGGVRAYSTLLIIQEIMKAIIRREKSYPDGPAESSYHPLKPPKAGTWLPCHYFDYIGGTGSGGLIAIMLGRLRMDVDDSIIAFEAVLKVVFSCKRWFHSGSFLFWPRPKFDHLMPEQVIQDLVRLHAPNVSGFPERSCFASDQHQCRTVVLAAIKPDILRAPYLFRTYNNFHSAYHEYRNFGLAHHVPIWQVIRATTASPAFFQPVTIDRLEYISGGFVMNNPCAEMYDEVRYMNGNSRDNIILSIGSGNNSIQTRNRKATLFQYMTHLKSIIELYSNSESVHQKMKGTPGYYRFNAEAAFTQAKVDEWHTRGRVRTSIGSWIGRHRLNYRENETSTQLVKLDDQVSAPNRGDAIDKTPFKMPQQANAKTPKEAAHRDQEPKTLTIAPKDRSPIPTVGENKSNIPKWLQPNGLTKDSIRRQTREYLDQEDVQSKINDIADLLVEKRRRRAGDDLERWEEFCYRTCYQCKAGDCPRAHKEYDSRRALQKHLLDKHNHQLWTIYEEASEAAL